MIRTVFRTSLQKIIAFFGGRKAFILVFALLICCLAATSLITDSPASEEVNVAIVDLCGGPISTAFCRQLSETDGIHAEILQTVSDGEEKMLYDAVEVLLILSPDYDERIMQDESEQVITLRTAPGTDSAQLLRETTAGLLMAQRSACRMKEKLTNEGFDISAFDTYMAEAKTLKLYSAEFRESNNKKNVLEDSLVHSSYNGVAVLALLLILLTVSKRMSDQSSRLVSERLETQQAGRFVSLMGDFTALFLVALLVSVCAFALSPQKSVPAAAAWVYYSLCISGLCLLISRFNSAGRIDILAPFLAILTSVIGGCFTDLSLLAEYWKILSRCVPQGQMLAASNGEGIMYAVMLAESVLAVFLSGIIHSRRCKTGT